MRAIVFPVVVIGVVLSAMVAPAVAGDATPTPGPPNMRCIMPEAPAVEWISQGLFPEDGTSIRHVWAVKSDAFENVWFVAADLEGPGLEGDDEIALWATNAIKADGTSDENGGGLVVSVDHVAQEFSDWFHADNYGVHRNDDGADEAIECAKADYQPEATPTATA